MNKQRSERLTQLILLAVMVLGLALSTVLFLANYFLASSVFAGLFGAATLPFLWLLIGEKSHRPNFELTFFFISLMGSVVFLMAEDTPFRNLAAAILGALLVSLVEVEGPVKVLEAGLDERG